MFLYLSCGLFLLWAGEGLENVTFLMQVDPCWQQPWCPHCYRQPSSFPLYMGWTLSAHLDTTFNWKHAINWHTGNTIHSNRVMFFFPNDAVHRIPRGKELVLANNSKKKMLPWIPSIPVFHYHMHSVMYRVVVKISHFSPLNVIIIQ